MSMERPTPTGRRASRPLTSLSMRTISSVPTRRSSATSWTTSNVPSCNRPKDPFPGYYISQTAFADVANHNERDPRGYVDARKINYVVRGNEAGRRGVKVGDFVAVYSKKTHKAVFAIVGDTGNPTGDEGSLHLLQNSATLFTTV